jgi:hypothetical protein
MNNYNVTVYNETIYGAFVPEQKIFRAMNLESLYDLLKMKGYKRYFIGSLSEPCYEN